MNSQNSSSIPLKFGQSLIQSVDVFCSEYGYKIRVRMYGDQICCHLLAQRVYYKYDQESFERKIQMCHMM